MEDGTAMTAKLLGTSIRDTESQFVPYAGEAESDIGKPLATDRHFSEWVRASAWICACVANDHAHLSVGRFNDVVGGQPSQGRSRDIC